MEVLPIKTRILQPPQDDLLSVLDTYLLHVKEKDVIVVSSKVVAIHEGSCEKITNQDKLQLIASQAELVIDRPYWGTPLTIIKNAFIGMSGIDESNADGHYVFLPKDPFQSAQQLHAYLQQRHNVNDIGVVITDSHSTPLRRGATGIAIGWWGFEPTINHIGEEDLFGRELRLEVTNLVDGLAAAANVVMGETNECQPIAILRDVPDLSFTSRDTKSELMVSFAEDTFRVLYERFIK